MAETPPQNRQARNRRGVASRVNYIHLVWTPQLHDAAPSPPADVHVDPDAVTDEALDRLVVALAERLAEVEFHREEQTHMKAVIYARYSTENQDARSIEDQERRCRAFAVARGLQVGGRLLGRSGLGHHDGSARTCSACWPTPTPARFKAVVVDDLSRLSRDRTDSAVVVRQLDDLGVQVVDAETGATSDDEASDVVFAVKGIVNAEYVKAIRRQRTGGSKGGRSPAYHTGGKTYGYSSIAEPNPADPTKPRRVPVIEPTEASAGGPRVRAVRLGPVTAPDRPGPERRPSPSPARRRPRGQGRERLEHTTIRAMLRNRRYRGELT